MAIKKEAYLSLSAMLRAREPRLLNAERAARMLDAASAEEAAKLLADCGYGDLGGMNASQLEEVLTGRRNAIFDELAGLAPDPGIVDLFRVKYDIHNIKTILKAEAMGVDPHSLLSRSGRIEPEKLLEARREEQTRDLPPILASAMKEAGELLARTSNPQLADFVLDRAYFEELLRIAGEVGNPFILGYVRLQIDCANLKSAVRTLRMGKDGEFMRLALIPGGNVDPDRILAAADGESLAALFQSGALEKAAALTAETCQGGPMTAFERSVDNAMNTYLRSAKLISYGPEPLAAYLAAAEGEITAVRMILTGRLSGVSAETIRERLRDLYA